ncbi:YkuS family protein [Bacillus kexueae]|uniref:YkuS family protein n=1 Tax=Aeribacillus kexueae TaxID=2078952 RepID=UPI001FAF37A4|nr:YkuS family protein [Bacillus kexueae]
MPKIGVEETLSDVTSLLQQKGYDVVPLKNEEDAKGCECCVISGQDENVMGMQNAATSGPVINASGMTAEEVCQQIENRVK